MIEVDDDWHENNDDVHLHLPCFIGSQIGC